MLLQAISEARRVKRVSSQWETQWRLPVEQRKPFGLTTPLPRYFIERFPDLLGMHSDEVAAASLLLYLAEDSTPGNP